MNGKIIVTGLLTISAIAGAGLWYTTHHLYYEEVTGVDHVMLGGEIRPVSGYRGIDAASSPLKLRACFDVDWAYAPADSAVAAAAEPLRAPYWFDCFDAREISRDIGAGRATVMLGEVNSPYGFTTFIAQYPGGRAYLWRQMNACGAAAAEGGDVPADCAPDGVGDARQAAAVTPLEMTLVPAGGGAPEPIIADDLQLVAEGSGIWACFRVGHSIPMLTETYEVADVAIPRDPAKTMPCFNAQDIARDMSSGAALPFYGARGVTPGVDRVVAIYDDGRAFAWHQRTE